MFQEGLVRYSVMRCCGGGCEVENKYTESLLNRDDDDKNAAAEDDDSGSFRLIIRTSLFFQTPGNVQ